MQKYVLTGVTLGSNPAKKLNKSLLEEALEFTANLANERKMANAVNSAVHCLCSVICEGAKPILNVFQ